MVCHLGETSFPWRNRSFLRVSRRETLPSSLILLIAGFFQPVHGFAIQLFLNGDMRHGRGGRCAVPMLLARREPDDAAGPDFFNRPAPALRASAAGNNDERLAERMCVLRRARTGFERDARTRHA